MFNDAKIVSGCTFDSKGRAGQEEEENIHDHDSILFYTSARPLCIFY